MIVWRSLCAAQQVQAALTIVIGISVATNPLRDRRIVDTVRVGDTVSDASHGYAASDVVSGTINGKRYRSARGWMRYALTTFDDTEVTLACTFLRGDGATTATAQRYDVLVEDSLIATRALPALRNEVSSELSTMPVVEEVVIPFVLTKGRTSIAVTIRAHDGPTPALSELRVIQDHNEVDRYAVQQSTFSLRATR